MFTIDEIEAITTGLTLLARTSDSGLSIAAKRVTEKIRDIAPEVSQHTLSDSAVFASTLHRMPEFAVSPEAIRGIIHAGEKIEIAYRDPNDSKTVRVILPIAMIFYVEAVVIVAWCDLRNDFRHFRLDRILSLETTREQIPETAAKLRQEWRDRIREPWVTASP